MELAALERFAALGMRQRDTAAERVHKRLLVYGLLATALASLVWAALYTTYASLGAAWPGYAGLCVALALLALYIAKVDYLPLLYIHVTVNLLLPLVAQALAGGFQASGCVGLWAVAGPLTVMVHELPGAVLWFGLFQGLLLAAIGLEPGLAAQVPPLAAGMSHYLLLFNMAGLLTVLLFHMGHVVQLRRRLHEQAGLQAHAQKMESVGRMAGGLAYELNNTVTALLSHTAQALANWDYSRSPRANLEGIRESAERSADLVRHLTVFARQETVVPSVLDLNNVVTSALGIIRCLVGEDIVVLWMPQAGLPAVRVDPSQVDRILVNLCVNARDAISGGGELTLETESVSVLRPDHDEHKGVTPGDYVLLSVSDSGCGMDEETLARIFEPFYTTKPQGIGAGLGLATVYGIVKQNGGFINVESEPSQGSTFRIYLPKFEGAPERPKPAPAEEARPPVRTTILLVDDEEEVLSVTAEMLERAGYHVLAAKTPGEAIRLARDNSGKVSLLLTDFAMPEMNGWNLAREIVTLDPLVKTLFMSGQPMESAALRGSLQDGIHFLQKPFSSRQVADMVRKALEDTETSLV